MLERVQTVRKRLNEAKKVEAKEEKTNLIRNELHGMIEEILDYIEFDKGDYK